MDNRSVSKSCFKDILLIFLRLFLYVLGYGATEIKLRALEGRVVELHTSKQHLEHERETLSRRINEDSETIKKLRLRSKELAQDVFMLKNLVMRYD